MSTVVKTPEQEHNERMAAAGRAALGASQASAPTATPAATPAVATPAATPAGDAKVRPEWCPEKYWNAETGAVNAEALARENAFLHSQRAKPTQTPAAGETGDQSTDTQTGGSVIADARAEFDATGSLSDATFAALEAAGIDRETVETYIENQKVVSTHYANSLYEVAEGQENYKKMLEWARTGLDEAEARIFDMAVTNRSTAKKAVSDLYAKYKEAVGHEGKPVDAGKPAAVAVELIRNKHELAKIVGSPEYKRDPQMQMDVAKRIRESQRQGLNPFA